MNQNLQLGTSLAQAARSGLHRTSNAPTERANGAAWQAPQNFAETERLL